jgi:F-type H+-transporting ATPase subunit b
MIDDRQKEIDDLYAGAEQAQAEAKRIQADYDRRIAQAEQTSAELISSAKLEATRRGDEIVRQAKADADALRAKAVSDAALEKKKAVNDAKDDISKIALDIAEKVVGKELNGADHDRLIEDFLRDMGDSV